MVTNNNKMVYQIDHWNGKFNQNREICIHTWLHSIDMRYELINVIQFKISNYRSIRINLEFSVLLSEHPYNERCTIKFYRNKGLSSFDYCRINFITLNVCVCVCVCYGSGPETAYTHIFGAATNQHNKLKMPQNF